MFEGLKRFGSRVVGVIRSNGKVVAVVLATGTVVALQQGAFAADTPEAITAFSTVVDIATLKTAAFTLGGTALAAAFTLGGGFRIAKKAYSWIMAKM